MMQLSITMAARSILTVCATAHHCTPHTNQTLPAPTHLYVLPPRSGRCPARHMMQRLLPRLQAGELSEATRVITHRLPMSQGVGAYDVFDRKGDGMVKCVLDPWA